MTCSLSPQYKISVSMLRVYGIIIDKSSVVACAVSCLSMPICVNIVIYITIFFYLINRPPLTTLHPDTLFVGHDSEINMILRLTLSFNSS